jgi:antitoxin (DNA-binding transcriptional repressor) of toxin-antitoxin stability system
VMSVGKDGCARPSYTRCMKSMQLSELGPLAEDVRNGETVEVLEGGVVLAKVVPVGHAVSDGETSIPDWFFTERPPKFPSSVLEQLLHDRRSRDW